MVFYIKKILRFLSTLTAAIFLAFIVRQSVFELYEIPSGSMRPTYRESDRLLVSKTTFGINLPASPSHIIFEPSLLKRGHVLIFTGENLPLEETDTLAFGFIPTKKRYIKRCMGLGGDTLYFYGGRVFGLDNSGKDLKNLRPPELNESLEFIPFISFYGRVQRSQEKNFFFTEFFLFQKSLFRIKTKPFTTPTIEIKENDTWVNTNDINPFSFAGMENFGCVRMVKKTTDFSTARLFLEIAHHPYIDTKNPKSPLSWSLSYLPLDQKAQDALFEGLYTARFTASQGMLYRHGSLEGIKDPFHIPEGTYEFDQGIPYAINWGGIRKTLPSSHPLMEKDADLLLFFFNQGISFLTEQEIHISNSARYLYFRDGDLFCLNKKIYTEDSSQLKRFVKKEKEQEEKKFSYKPFIDPGAPFLENGELNKDLIHKNGYQIPEAHICALGDNHAMSGDSRYFGAVPYSNIQGSPAFLFWPPQERMGFLEKSLSPSIFTLGVWITIAILAFIYGIFSFLKKKT